MKKSISLLFLLLIACAPVATIPPTITALPPTPTITPSPTATPDPTATPSAPREAEGRGVEIWDGTKWVKLEPPNTIWGDKPEGASVVLKDGEVVLQMELNNFQDVDGNSNVDIAKYNIETKSWVVHPFSITRTTLGGEHLYNGNYSVVKAWSGEGVDLFFAGATILGFKVNPDLDGRNKLDVMILYKGKVDVVRPEEFAGSLIYVDRGYENKNFAFDEINLEMALDIIRMANENHRDERGYGSAYLAYIVLNKGATESSCTPNPSNF